MPALNEFHQGYDAGYDRGKIVGFADGLWRALRLISPTATSREISDTIRRAFESACDAESLRHGGQHDAP